MAKHTGGDINKTLHHLHNFLPYFTNSTDINLYFLPRLLVNFHHYKGQSLPLFRKRLKTTMFDPSFPWLGQERPDKSLFKRLYINL